MVTGEGINTFIRDFVIEGDLTFTIDINTDTSFNTGASLGGLNGTNLPQRIDGTVINSFDDLVSLENTSANLLRVKIVGFSGSTLARASNAVTNKMIGTSKRLSTYNEHVAKTGGDTIVLLNTSETGLIQNKYELANGEGDTVTVVGTQEVTSMYEIQGGGVLSDILSIESDGQQQLVYVNPNPNGISPETLASILLSRGIGNYTSIIDAINNSSGGGGGSSEVSLNTAGLAQLESKLDEQSNEHQRTHDRRK